MDEARGAGVGEGEADVVGMTFDCLVVSAAVNAILPGNVAASIEAAGCRALGGLQRNQ